MDTLSATLSSLGLCPVNSSCLDLPDLTLQLWVCQALPGSTSLHCTLETLSRQDAEAITGFTSLVSYLSGTITSLLCPKSSVLKTFSRLFCLVFHYIRWENKSGPCYSILSGCRSPLSFCKVIAWGKVLLLPFSSSVQTDLHCRTAEASYRPAAWLLWRRCSGSSLLVPEPSSPWRMLLVSSLPFSAQQS